jgi:hypothetical protein
VRELVNAVARSLDEMKEERDAATLRHADAETSQRSRAEIEEQADAAGQEDEDEAIERGVGESRWSA